MSKLIRDWLLASFFLFCLSLSEGPRKKLLYVMLDGFRYDYVDDQPPESLPGFTRLLQNGVRAEYMSPIYPSISYPDWTTLVTGLWAESHGIVGNNFYDAQEKDKFTLIDSVSTGQKKWWTAEPIWTTATKASLKTGVILWSRCDIPFDTVVPEYCEAFVITEGQEIFKRNVEKSLDMLEKGFDFVQVYNPHIDSIGHKFGPETEERMEAVRDLDSIILAMLERIEHMEMADQINIVLVSDHGMTTTAPGSVQRVQLDDYLESDYVEDVGEVGAYSNIKVKEGFTQQVYSKLRTMPGVEVYRHDDIPDELHFKNHKYIHDILVKADINTFIIRSPEMTSTKPYAYNGAHGYDPREEKMRAIFFAAGPDFRKGESIPPIQNVDVYSLLAHLLKLDPLPNNGTFENVKMALKNSPNEANHTNEDLSISVSSGVQITSFYLEFFCFLSFNLFLKI